MRMLIQVSTLCALASAVAWAQDSVLEGRCYHFDRPYFTAVGRFPNGPVFSRSADVLKLRPDSSAALAPGARRLPMRAVQPIPFLVDFFTYHIWMSMSGWRRIGADSVEIEWRNGLYGPVFRMAVRADSLVGQFIQTTDAHPYPEPPPRAPEPARAVRVHCAG